MTAALRDVEQAVRSEILLVALLAVVTAGVSAELLVSLKDDLTAATMAVSWAGQME